MTAQLNDITRAPRPRSGSDRVQGITWKIGGEAGFGIMSTGEMFARACMRAGLNVFTYPEYPSLIRGGHNTVQVTASTQPVHAHRAPVNILVALNYESIDLHLAELTPRAAIIYDTTDRTFTNFKPASIKRRDLQIIGLPLEKLAEDASGPKLMRNTVALGASCALLEIPPDHLAEVVRVMFGDKGETIVALNVKVLMSGYDAIAPAQRKQCPWDVKPAKNVTPMALLTGNEALALGAIQAGCQFYSAYPMTPATSILHYLAQHGPDYGVVVRHAEDEIGAINQAIGAAYTGVRAMTATSGGGFSLMTEAVGMAAMTEVGIVVIDAQRGGPSTGLPTWTEQGDLRQVLHASQGDFPRVVLAPSSHRECFTMIQEAFNLAEQYQTPVIVLTDKYLAEGQRNVSVGELKLLPINRGKIWTATGGKTAAAYLRYQADVADGIVPRSLPGTPNGLFLANSDEHDEYGYSNEDAPNRLAQMERRARKVATLRKKSIPPRYVGPAKAPLTVVTWGSSAGAVEAALDILDREHKLQANAIIITMIAPFPTAAVTTKLKSAKRTVIVEANQTGQLAGWIRQQTGLTFDHAINRYDGRPFDPIDLANELKSYLLTS
ncbi:MAG: 2-oxoacid:acceptor oxidoreductase subunit alpha [Patescibacteria group bacterium]